MQNDEKGIAGNVPCDGCRVPGDADPPSIDFGKTGSYQGHPCQKLNLLKLNQGELNLIKVVKGGGGGASSNLQTPSPKLQAPSFPTSHPLPDLLQITRAAGHRRLFQS